MGNYLYQVAMAIYAFYFDDSINLCIPPTLIHLVEKVVSLSHFQRYLPKFSLFYCVLV